MTKEFEDKGNNYTISEKVNIGEVKVADEVVAIIAGLAATEVDGVESMAGNISNELVSKLGMKNLSKGVKVFVEEKTVTVDLALNIKYGKEIPVVSNKVQENVKSAIETMTGLEVSAVNIKVVSLNTDAQ
ncbi:MAG: Asp23/Gls24 family envelope stress response protein [Lachnospira sp.]|nr:Asp23/Gls24 family envelope stress response protein [Lachnospira sp.]